MQILPNAKVMNAQPDMWVAKTWSKGYTPKQARELACRYARCREAYHRHAAEAFAFHRLLQKLKGKTATAEQQLELVRQRDRENDALADYLYAREEVLASDEVEQQPNSSATMSQLEHLQGQSTSAPTFPVAAVRCTEYKFHV